MTVICRNTRCRFCKSGFCTRQYVMLNEAGGCSLWFIKKGMSSLKEIVEPEIYSDPSYRGNAETEVDGAIKQGSPHEEKIEPPAENQENAEISEPTEKDEGEQ